jgi:chaperonin GroES
MKIRPLHDRIVVRRLEEDSTSLDVKVGDQVLFGKYTGTEVKVDAEELLVMREDDIMAVFDA